MNVIILAAGKGERLYPLTKDIPKSLICLGNGKTILETQIDVLKSVPAIKKIMIVVGYRAEKIEERVHSLKLKTVETIYNPFFDITNNLVSVWCARSKMLEEDFILINGDDIFNINIIKGLRRLKNGVFVTIDRKDEYDEDDMKVISKGKRILHIGKQLDKNKANGESVGIIKVAGNGREKYITALDNLIKNKDNLQKFHLEIIQYLANTDFQINYFECSRNDWAEIDFHPDIEVIKSNINLSFWHKPNSLSR